MGLLCSSTRHCTKQEWKLSTQDIGIKDPDYDKITSSILTEAQINHTMIVYGDERSIGECSDISMVKNAVLSKSHSAASLSFFDFYSTQYRRLSLLSIPLSNSVSNFLTLRCLFKLICKVILTLLRSTPCPRIQLPHVRPVIDLNDASSATALSTSDD